MDDTVLRGKNVLVVDDEVDLREIVASELEYIGAIVHQAGNITAADAILKKNEIDLVISDIRMPGGTGVDLLKTVKARNVLSPPIILITGFADITFEEAYSEGAEALISKPFQLDELIQVSARLIQPLEKKFSEKADSTGKVLSREFPLPMKETGFFELGRGGFVLKTDNSKKYDVGENLTIKLSFADTVINGVAVPRWAKVCEHEGCLCIGLELLYIEPATFDFLSQYWKSSPGLAFIPKSL